MRLSWTQAATGALIAAAVAGLLILPGRLLGPNSGGQEAVLLPAAAAPKPVEAAPVTPASHRIAGRHAPAKTIAVVHTVPIVNTIPPAAAPVAKLARRATKVAKAAAGRPTSRRTRHELAPDPPAAVTTPTTTTTTPTTTTPTTTTPAPAPVLPPTPTAPAATPTAAPAAPPATNTPATPVTAIVAGVIQTTVQPSAGDQHDGHDQHDHDGGSGNSIGGSGNGGPGDGHGHCHGR